MPFSTDTDADLSQVQSEVTQQYSVEPPQSLAANYGKLNNYKAPKGLMKRLNAYDNRSFADRPPDSAINQ